MRAGRSLREATCSSLKGALELGLWAASQPQELARINLVRFSSRPGLFEKKARRSFLRVVLYWHRTFISMVESRHPFSTAPGLEGQHVSAAQLKTCEAFLSAMLA